MSASSPQPSNLPLPAFALPFKTPPQPAQAIFPSYLFDVKAGPTSAVHPSSAGPAPSSPHIKFESSVAAWTAQKDTLVGLGIGKAATARKRRRRRLKEGVLVAAVAMLLAGLVLFGWTRLDATRHHGRKETVADEGSVRVAQAIDLAAMVEHEASHYTIQHGGSPTASTALGPTRHRLNLDALPLRPTAMYLPALNTRPPMELLFPHSRPKRSSATIVLPVPALPDHLDDLVAALVPLMELTTTPVMLACPDGLVQWLNAALVKDTGSDNVTVGENVQVVGWSDHVPSSADPVDGHALPLLHLLGESRMDLSDATYLVLPALVDLLDRIPVPALSSTLRPLLSYPPQRLRSSEHAPLFLASARMSASSLLPVVTSIDGDEPVPVAFGMPPMLVGSRLLRASTDGLRTSSDRSSGVWAALGERIVVGEGRGVGGWVVPSFRPATKAASAEDTTVSMDMETFESVLNDQLRLQEDGSPSSAQLSLHLALSSPTPLSDRGRVALVLPSIDALEILTPLACALFRTGHDVSIRLPWADEANGEAIGGDNCWLRYEGGGDSLRQTGDQDEAMRQQDRAPADVTIVGEGMEYDLLESEQDAVRIVVPAGDLEVGSGASEIWDWVGTLGLSSLKHWHTPQIHLSIITSSRPASLVRLLDSLRSAHYLSPTLSGTTSPSVPLSISLERDASAETHAVVGSYDWPHGQVTVRHRVKQGGVLLAVTEAWYPRTDDEYGILLEDDIELSPLFYAWAKWTILAYRYDPSPSSNLFGISLYQQKNNELRLSGRVPFSAKTLFRSLGDDPSTATSPYLSQIPSSWGAIYFPETWRAFHTYLAWRLETPGWPRKDDRKYEDIHRQPGGVDRGPFQILPDSRSSNWSASWKRYLIDYLHLTGPKTMLYPNFKGDLSLSTNHLEPGAHVKRPAKEEEGKDEKSEAWQKYLRKKESFEVPLIPRGGKEGGLVGMMPGGRLPRVEALRRVDFFGRVVGGGDEELEERGSEARERVERECVRRGGRAEMEGLVCVGGSEGGRKGKKAMKDGKRSRTPLKFARE